MLVWLVLSGPKTKERKMKIEKWISSAKLIFISLALLASAAFGQETTGGIEGTVRDSAGAVVPNVTVTISSAKESLTGTTTTGVGSGFKRTITTDGDGFFRVLQVPPGTYEVVTTATGGFGAARYENVTVAIGRNTQLEIGVNPGGGEVSVDVSVSDAPPVDTTNSTIQTTINAQKIELIPKSTGFTGLLKTVPGTRPNPGRAASRWTEPRAVRMYSLSTVWKLPTFAQGR